MYGSELPPPNSARISIGHRLGNLYDRLVTGLKISLMGLPTDEEMVGAGRKDPLLVEVEQETQVNGGQAALLLAPLADELVSQGQSERVLFQAGPVTAEHWHEHGFNSNFVGQVKLMVDNQKPAIFYLEIKKTDYFEEFNASRLVFERQGTVFGFKGLEVWSKGGLVEAKDGLGNGFEKEFTPGWYNSSVSTALKETQSALAMLKNLGGNFLDGKR